LAQKLIEQEGTSLMLLDTLELALLEKGEQKQITLGTILGQIPFSQAEIVATALWNHWQNLGLSPHPLLIRGEKYGAHFQHQAAMLDLLLTRASRWKRARFGQLAFWEKIDCPPQAYGIASVPLSELQNITMVREASVHDRKTIAGPATGWRRYDFESGWTGFSVLLPIDGDGMAETITILPQGRQDEWLAFLALLRKEHHRILHQGRKRQLEVLGDTETDIEMAVRQTTFEDVILPDAILAQVAAQRRIFDPEILDRYATLRVPRLRKVVLIGPPGTGKTTLVKAEAAAHLKRGGLVYYVLASKKPEHSWDLLSYALTSAAQSKLPTLVVVEDLEQFISGATDPQRVLNTLDGVETPDNPAGTLLLATSNAPEKIDGRIKDRPGRIDLMIEVGPIAEETLASRFLQRHLRSAYNHETHGKFAAKLVNQTGSHVQQVCLLAAIHALDENRTDIFSC
jgi:hypothetical protein